MIVFCSLRLWCLVGFVFALFFFSFFFLILIRVDCLNYTTEVDVDTIMHINFNCKLLLNQNEKQTHKWIGVVVPGTSRPREYWQFHAQIYIHWIQMSMSRIGFQPFNTWCDFVLFFLFFLRICLSISGL